MNTVSKIINAVSYEDVAEAFKRLYDKEPVNYLSFRDDLNTAVTVDTGEGMVIVFSEDRLGMMGVSGRTPDGTTWALDLTPWSEWKAMPVDSDLPLAEQAAHLYYEMTWHGKPSDTENLRDNLLDSIEQLERDITDGKYG